MGDERKTLTVRDHKPGTVLEFLNGKSNTTLRYVAECGDCGSVVFDVPVGTGFWFTVGRLPARVFTIEESDAQM
jgi:hypothetical protein